MPHRGLVIRTTTKQISNFHKQQINKHHDNQQNYSNELQPTIQGQPTPNQTRGWVFALKAHTFASPLRQTPFQSLASLRLRSLKITTKLYLSLQSTITPFEVSVAKDHHQTLIFPSMQCTAKTHQKVKGPKWLKDAWGQAHQKVKGVKWSKFQNK